ncbi:hypothetical protein ACG2LH_15595 [Zhouia sp. PK063]|uniref:hypothetical protein n=1 Tax=Zhouia sp. PK063 TaxID=3373602 RepID=UPI0037946F31
MKRKFEILFIILLTMTACSAVKQEKGISSTTTIESNFESKTFTSQSKLSAIALNDSDNEVRKSAVEKLTIQSTLSTVALNDSDSDIRKLAVSKLTIQSTLSTVALNDKDSDVRKLALKRLN